jgi:hypothetical protein
VVVIKTCSNCGETKTLDMFYKQNKISKTKGKFTYYNPECKVCTIKRSRAWELNPDNKDRFLANKAKQNKKEVNKEYRREVTRRKRESGEHKTYYYDNQQLFQDYNTNRQKKNHTITMTEWFDCKNYFNNECAYCGLKASEHYYMYDGELKLFDLHREHVDDEGANDLSNCVPACKLCNSYKWKYSLEEWYNSSNKNFSLERLNKIIKWVSEDYKLFMKC